MICCVRSATRTASSLGNASAYFTTGYFVCIGLALALSVYLMFEPRVAVPDKLVAVGIAAVLAMSAFVVPLGAGLQQEPIKEAALLFESGSVSDLDFVIGVRAPRALRLHRAMHRDGLTREEVLSRMERQMDEGIKMKLCDYIIENNEQQLVIPQVLDLHRRFLRNSST